MSIKTEMLHGVVWSAVEKYSGLIIQLVITAVLARLLTPTDFGVIAIATVLTTFFNMFTDMGVGAAIVQNQNLTQNDLDALFSFSVYVGSFLAVVFFFCSSWVASFYSNQLLTPICRILSLNLLFAAWNMVPNALIRKAKRFKFIAIRTFTLQVICGLLAVAVAFLGGGVYALLITPVITSVGVFVINYRQQPLGFCVKVNKGALEKVMSFSVFQFLFSFINYFSRNLDKLILGRFYSLYELGFYEKSYRLMLLPMNYVTNVITPVMHPILTSLQNDFSELADKYNKILRLLLVISFPMGAFLYYSAEDIIMIMFGNQWGAAVPVFKILALSLPLQMILSTTGAIYQAANRTKWMFYGGLLNTCITVLGFIIAAVFYHDINAMAWAWDITLFLNSINSFAILYLLVLKKTMTPLLKSFVYPIACACAIVMVLGGLEMIDINLPYFIDGVMKFSVCFLLMIGTLQLSGVYDLRRIIKKRK